MDAIDFFLLEHARAHSGALLAEEPDALAPHLPGGAAPRHEWDRQRDILLDGFTDAQLRLSPDGLNSLAWIVWHMARSEDLKIALLTGRAQVFEDGWHARFGAGPRDAGTAMVPEQVAALNAGVNLDALRDYAVAVGRQTRAAVQVLRGQPLDAVFDEEAILGRLEQEAMITAPVVVWERNHGFFRNRTTAWMLSQVISHNAIHIGEGLATVQRIRCLAAQEPNPS